MGTFAKPSLLFILLLSAALPSFGMNKTKSFFKKGLGIAATVGTGALVVTNYGLSFALPGSLVYSKIKGSIKEKKELPEPPESVKQFIQANLAIQGVHNSDQIQIKHEPVATQAKAALHSPSVFNNTVFVPCYPKYSRSEQKILPRSILQDTLEKNDEDYYEHDRKMQLAEQSFIYRHEANHIKYHDTKKILGVSIFIPCAIKGISFLLKKSYRPKQLLKNLLAIPGGILTTYTNIIFSTAYRRMTEQRADDDIVADDPKILKAGIKFFKQMQRYEPHERIPASFSDHLLKIATNIRTHPRLQHRINRLKERKKALEGLKHKKIKKTKWNNY